MRISVTAGCLLLGLLAFFAWRSVGRVADADHGTKEVLVITGTVRRIVDGDTVDVMLDSGKVRVRMQGIDAPESDQPLAGEAAGLLQQLIGAGDVELQVAEQTSYDRLVARIFVGGADANAEMLKRGFAMAERRYLDEFAEGESYCLFEHSARTAKAGIWGLEPDQRIAPWEWRRREDQQPFTDYSGETVEGCVAAIGRPFGASKAESGPADAPVQPPNFTCGAKSTCPTMVSCAEAKFYFETCGVSTLDGNADGIPCNDICR